MERVNPFSLQNIREHAGKAGLAAGGLLTAATLACSSGEASETVTPVGDSSSPTATLTITPEKTATPVIVTPTVTVEVPTATAIATPTEIPETPEMIAEKKLLDYANSVLNEEYQIENIEEVQDLIDTEKNVHIYRAKVNVNGVAISVEITELTDGTPRTNYALIEQKDPNPDGNVPFTTGAGTKVESVFSKYFKPTEFPGEWTRNTVNNQIVTMEKVRDTEEGHLETLSAYMYGPAADQIVVGASTCTIYPAASNYEARTCFAEGEQK